MSAVLPVWVVAALTSAPLAMRTRTRSTFPVRDAVMSGVRPLVCATSARAPAARSVSTIIRLAFSAARSSGVTPWSSAASASAARSRRAVSTSSQWLAHSSAVAPSGRRSLTSAPSATRTRTAAMSCSAAASTRLGPCPAACAAPTHSNTAAHDSVATRDMLRLTIGAGPSPRPDGNRVGGPVGPALYFGGPRSITIMPKLLSAVALIGLLSVAAPSAQEPSRALLDQYCVTCHNDRLKTADLALDTVDIGAVEANAEVLEKVVRKLRSGQMPPEGRPRLDAATIETFATSLETALDRAAVSAPNPGRVASRRLNRVEYVNVIEDLLALEIDGGQLLPSDMAGFGFDNNADVLSITPALMGRYIAAATKISRAAIGSPDSRPVTEVYKVGFERRDVRVSEEMPFGTHGGLSVRHTFPLDGEYVFAVRLKRNDTVETIDGIGEDEHQIEVRVDHALVRRFPIGGRFPGVDPGSLIAVSEDDIEGQRLHEYRMTADHELEIRVPIKAGTRLVAVGFTDAAPSPNPPTDLPGVDMLYISGPFDGRVPEDTPSRRRIFTCRPAGASDEESCARQIIAALARRAYRRPVTDADVDPLLSPFREGRADRDFESGIERALEALLSMPQFLMRVEREPVDTHPGDVYPLSDLELAARLSFFLWRSIPDDELLDLAADGRLSAPEVLTAQVRRMLDDRRATRFMNDFVGQWLQVRNIHAQDPDGALFAGFNDTLRTAMVRETELFFES